jgi:hypothetical protein
MVINGMKYEVSAESMVNKSLDGMIASLAIMLNKAMVEEVL